MYNRKQTHLATTDRQWIFTLAEFATYCSPNPRPNHRHFSRFLVACFAQHRRERAGMPELKSILSFVVLGFVLAPGTALAVDECLSKPNAPASKGQHWYYRVDRANNNRQCWRLGPEGLRVQKSEPQVQKTKPQGTVKPEPPPPTQRPATTGMAIASADVSAVGAVGTAPATGWLDVTKFPDSPPTSQPASQSPPVEPTQSIVASDSEPQVANPVVATGGVVSSTGSDDPVAQSRSTTQEPAREAEDHTFVLLTRRPCPARFRCRDRKETSSRAPGVC
jgi:hypothetical protein